MRTVLVGVAFGSLRAGGVTREELIEKRLLALGQSAREIFLHGPHGAVGQKLPRGCRRGMRCRRRRRFGYCGRLNDLEIGSERFQRPQISEQLSEGDFRAESFFDRGADLCQKERIETQIEEAGGGRRVRKVLPRKASQELLDRRQGSAACGRLGWRYVSKGSRRFFERSARWNRWRRRVRTRHRRCLHPVALTLKRIGGQRHTAP